MSLHKQDYDYVVIGSGFGGSVSALRLSEKGYRVLVIEKGKWWNSKDFAKTNWNLKRWMWLPALRFWHDTGDGNAARSRFPSTRSDSFSNDVWRAGFV